MNNVIEQTKEYIQELKDERKEFKADYHRLLKTAEGLNEKNERLEEENRAMKQYIRNGIELGYINDKEREFEKLI